MRQRPWWRRVGGRLKALGYRTATIVERIARRSDALLPPAHLRVYYYRRLDPTAFRRAGDSARIEALSHGLLPGHRVLDVGSGIGNLAIGLADYLTGSYEGIDIHGEAVEWCQRQITPRFPGFRFHHANVASRAYNPKGTVTPSRLVFPFPNADFDFVFLGSVFTHMLPADIEHYLHEIRRVLRPSGICVASFFLLNDERRSALDAHRGFMSFDFTDASGLARLHDETKPEAAVAVDEAFVATAYQKSDLSIRAIRRGDWWNGRDDDQDVITAGAASRSSPA